MILAVLWWLAFMVFSRHAYSDLEVQPSPSASLSDSYVIATSQVSIVAPKESIRAIIITEAQNHHISADLLVRIAVCESGLKPTAKNTQSTASGLFQFLDSTFSSQAKFYGISGNKNDPQVQAKLAATIIADPNLKTASNPLGGLRHWTESKSCWAQGSQSSKSLLADING